MEDRFGVLRSKARHGSLRVGSLFRQASVSDEDSHRFLTVGHDSRSALVHQRSSESHDSTISGVSMQSCSSEASGHSGGKPSRVEYHSTRNRPI